MPVNSCQCRKLNFLSPNFEKGGGGILVSVCVCVCVSVCVCFLCVCVRVCVPHGKIADIFGFA